MPGDKDDKKKGPKPTQAPKTTQGSKPAQARQETLQVRVRAKNPQIDRKRAPIDAEAETVLHERDDPPPPPRKPVRVADLMDEDATEIADRPPAPPKEILFVRTAEVKRPKAERPAPASSDVPTAPGQASGRTDRVVPKGRMLMKGTDAAGALAAQARVERAEGDIPSSQLPVLKLIKTHLGHEATGSIERILSGEFDTREPGSAPHSPKRALERLIYMPDFSGLEPPLQARVLAAIAQEPRAAETTKSATRLLVTGVAKTLNPRDRTLLIELFEAVSTADRALLASVAERPLRASSAILDRDFEDTLLIGHLHALAFGPRLHDRLAWVGEKTKDVLTEMLTVIANPERIPLAEGADAVLSVLEFGLADAAPAEYARLWRDLVTGDLVAELPGEGALDLGEHLATSRPPREGSEARPSPFVLGLEILAGLAHPRTGPTKDAFIMPGGHGLDADVASRALGFLYGVGFTVAPGATIALRHLERLSGDSYRVPPAFISILHEGGERLFVFDHIEGETVYFRSPHGTSSKPKGARRMDPERTVEDPSRGLESITLAVFKDNAGVALVPRG